jgi:TonB family protein
MESFEQRGFFQRFGFVLGIVGIVAVVAVIFLGQSLFKKSIAPPRKAPEVTMIKIVPPATPPPPPPPPPPQQKLEQKMIEQTPIENEEQKPDEAPAPAAASLGTNIQGSGGPDAFGLSGNGRGTVLGGGPARATASRWGWYAGHVQSSISDALRKNPRTREASFRVEVRVWADLTGRITRATLGESTGNAALDEAIKADVLTGLQLPEPPPDGMPMPIVMRLTARRPN